MRKTTTISAGLEPLLEQLLLVPDAWRLMQGPEVPEQPHILLDRVLKKELQGPAHNRKVEPVRVRVTSGNIFQEFRDSARTQLTRNAAYPVIVFRVGATVCTTGSLRKHWSRWPAQDVGQCLGTPQVWKRQTAAQHSRRLQDTPLLVQKYAASRKRSILKKHPFFREPPWPNSCRLCDAFGAARP